MSKRARREERSSIKRSVGLIACSECNRLKQRCDRKLPACGPCVRRGCEYLCPNGIMPQTRGPYKTKTKPENPVVPVVPVSVAATQDEEYDLSVLASRIQQLEDALLLLQSSTSSEQHPLLADDLLQIKDQWARRRFKGVHQPETHELADYVGTLSIGAHGDAKYLGSFGGTEGLLHIGAQELQSSPEGHSNDPNAVILPAKPTIEDFIQNLPPKYVGWELCEIYLQNGSIRERFVQRNQLMQEIFEPSYAIYTGQDTSSQGSRTLTTHKIATLFLVFAIGSRLDITLPFDNPQADRYFQLGQLALSLGNMSVLSSAELCTVQALLLLALYHLYSGRRYDLDTSWTIASLAVKCAESLGLHLESTLWNLGETILNRRRAVWWEAFSFDLIHSSHLGRPPTVRPSYMNCKLPDAPEDAPYGPVDLNIDNWRWTLSKDVFASYVEQVSGTERPPYSAVLEADRNLQNVPVPSAFQVDMTTISDEEKNLPVHVYLRKHLCMEKYFISSLHIHRHSFIRAVLEYASSPLGSPYGPSFLASYKAAASIISLFVKHMNRCPDVLMRCWAFWGTLLSVTMVVGSIVVRCPSSSFAPKAYFELGLALAIFERGAEQFTRAKSGLVIVRRLMGRATEIFHSLDRSASKDQLKEELEIFGGQTKVLFNGLASPEQAGRPPIPSKDLPVANWLELYSSSEITADPTTSFPDEFLTSLMDNSSAATQSQWQTQTGPTPEWHAFIQQAGLL